VTYPSLASSRPLPLTGLHISLYHNFELRFARHPFVCFGQVPDAIFVFARRPKRIDCAWQVVRLPLMEFVHDALPKSSPYATIARHGERPMTILRVTRREFVVALGGAAVAYGGAGGAGGNAI